MIRLMCAAAAVTLVAGCGGMSRWTTDADRGMGYQHTPASMRSGMWTGPNGMTLYTFDKDTMGAGTSVCNGPCATNWPPLYAPDGTPAQTRGDWSVVRRDDGRLQWAYKGRPLYYWVKDTKPGDMTGDGVNGAWRVARP